jgi:hypothetical protein
MKSLLTLLLIATCLLLHNFFHEKKTFKERDILDKNFNVARTTLKKNLLVSAEKQISAYKDPSTVIFARTICGGEVASAAPRQEKLRILQVAERRAKDCGTSVGDELLKHMQFSAWNGSGLIVDKTNIHEFSRCLSEAVEIITGPRELWTANFYHAVGTVPNWDMSKMNYSGISGGHQFYTSSERNYCLAAVAGETKGLVTLTPGKVKKKVTKRYETDYEAFVLNALREIKK